MFDVIKRLFVTGVWNEESVAKWVKLKKITKEEYFLITGHEYID